MASERTYVVIVMSGYDVAQTSLSMVGKASITMTYCVIYVMASEIFPTEARNVGMGIGSVAGGIGSMIAPYIGAPLVMF
jgi:MFS family permease